LTIGIIEDEIDLLELLEFSLLKEGFDAVGFPDTKRVEQFILEENPSLLIVDRNLPEIEGTKFIKDLRIKNITTPVIYLTAKNSSSDIIEGFESGADDYITKPFNMKELIVRIKAVLKRTNNLDEIIIYKNINLDITKREVHIENTLVDLTKKEFDLLEFFIKNRQRVLSRENLIDEVWNGETNEKSVNVAITRLKQKVGDVICAVRGVGYKLC
jgi:DNA-binding response OmpR family regulator